MHISNIKFAALLMAFATGCSLSHGRGGLPPVPATGDGGRPFVADSGSVTVRPDACPVGECSVGETRYCYSGTPETDGVGQCHGSEQLCIVDADGAARWERSLVDCVGEVTPYPWGDVPDDGIDNDCDGETDEDSGLPPGEPIADAGSDAGVPPTEDAGSDAGMPLEPDSGSSPIIVADAGTDSSVPSVEDGGSEGIVTLWADPAMSNCGETVTIRALYTGVIPDGGYLTIAHPHAASPPTVLVTCFDNRCSYEFVACEYLYTSAFNVFVFDADGHIITWAAYWFSAVGF